MKRFALERHKKGQTLQDLADQMEVNIATIRTWEQGESSISPKNFKKLLDFGFCEKSLINPTEEV